MKNLKVMLTLGSSFLLTFSLLQAQNIIDQAVGFYSNGELVNGSHLDDEGKGFIKLFRERDRAWGTQELVTVITETASTLKENFPDSEHLQIGDLGQEKGGKITRHSSHQNGLDVDIVYYRENRQEQDLNEVDGFIEQFVVNGKLTPNFDLERNWALIKMLGHNPLVARMFVDPVIKKSLCNYAKMEKDFLDHTEALRKLRPLTGHADHVHVRLNCPENSTRCIKQDPPSEGSGCQEVRIKLISEI